MKEKGSFEELAEKMHQQAQQHEQVDLMALLKRHQSFRQEIQKSQQSWLRFLVATSGTLFAVLIALGEKTALAGYARPVYGWAIAALGCGIVMLCIALYEQPFHHKKDLAHFLQEVQKAEAEARETDVVLAYKTPAIFGICEKAGYIFLIAAVLLLVALSLLLYVA